MLISAPGCKELLTDQDIVGWSKFLFHAWLKIYPGGVCFGESMKYEVKDHQD